MQPVYQRGGLPRADCGPSAKARFQEPDGPFQVEPRLCSIGQGLFHWPRAVPGARRVVGEILYEVGLFGEIGAVPEDGGAGFVNLIFGAAGVGTILEGEACAERQFERLTKEAVNLDILK